MTSRIRLEYFSEDPIGFAAGDANLYRYVGNSPTNATDPNGLQQQALNITREIVRDGQRPGQKVVLSWWSLPWKIFWDYADNIFRDYLAGAFGGDSGIHQLERWYTPGMGRHPNIARFVTNQYRRIGAEFRDRIVNGPPGELGGFNRAFANNEVPVFTEGAMQAALGGSHGMDLAVTNMQIVPGGPGGQCFLRFDARWTWRDEIDWHSFGQLFNVIRDDPNTPIGAKAIAWVEGLLDLVGDQILGLNFPIELEWRERVEIRVQ